MSSVLDFPNTDVLTPSQHLRVEMARLGVDQQTLATKLGVSRQIINYVLNDKQRISRNMAAKLGTLMGVPSDYWLRSSFPAPDTVPEINSDANQTPANDVHRPQSAILVDFELRRLIGDGTISVTDFDDRNIRPASLDLTIGEFAIDMWGNSFEVSKDTPYILEPGHAVNLATVETIRLTQHYVGRVGGLTEHARLGLVLSHGFQIDPGFHGVLEFCLFNAGVRNFEVTPGIPVISLEIAQLAFTPENPFTEKDARLNRSRDETQSTLRDVDRVGAIEAFLKEELVGLVKIEGDGGNSVASLEGLTARTQSANAERARENCASAAAGIVVSCIGNSRIENAGDILAAFDALAAQIRLDRGRIRGFCTVLGATFSPPNLVTWADGRRRTMSMPAPECFVSLADLCLELGGTASQVLSFKEN